MILPDFAREDELHARGYKRIAGVDEAGRGALAGPIVAAAVILPKDVDLTVLKLRDSKKLSENQREALYEKIISRCIDYHVAVLDNTVIDTKGITFANTRVMVTALSTLKTKPDYALIDLVRGALGLTSPHELIVKGDAHVASIAAASIVAKVTRDALMRDLARHYPNYGFDSHKGYGTKSHRAKITLHGPCPIHRKSYTLTTH